MKHASRFLSVILVLSVVQFACSLLAPTRVPAQTDAGSNGGQGTQVPATLAPVQPAPTQAASGPSELEVVQFQDWTDYQGNARANVLLRNPNAFPVSVVSRSAALRDGAGGLIKAGTLYFLDGISGGTGFILPGETIAANVCFTCEQAVLTEAWASVNFSTRIQDATNQWKYSTEVEARAGNVSFDGDKPIFSVAGTVKNNTASKLQRISVRITVFDSDGKLAGAAEASVWDVEAGATVNFDGYGIGQAPKGPAKYEVTALGVNY